MRALALGLVDGLAAGCRPALCRTAICTLQNVGVHMPDECRWPLHWCACGLPAVDQDPLKPHRDSAPVLLPASRPQGGRELADGLELNLLRVKLSRYKAMVSLLEASRLASA